MTNPASLRKIRVMVVDDSMVARSLIIKGLSAHPRLEVVGYAINTLDAKNKIPQYKPDVITMDVEMPGQSGIDFLKEYLPTHPIPVILVSSLNLKVFDALAVGAVDFVRKPDDHGTSETTFSPDQAISRGMLATVLYSLEGSPDQDAACTFSDVSGETWYADGVVWATENGIASGYGNGQFGPNDSITREQFVVMLWKYAGSPKAGNQALGFTDSDQASGYALEALSWAVEKGIMSGYANGQLAPGGTATRAQAAQMLKNFMEST